MTQAIKTNVLIVGAGPAGLSAALFLAKKGIQSTVVDKATFPRDKICGDALSGKVVELIRKLDERFIAELNMGSIFLPSWGVSFYSPSGERLRVPFRTKKKTFEAPGFISKRVDFDNWLVSKAKANAHIQLIEDCEIRQYERTPDGLIATSKSGQVFYCKLVIAADGAYSAFTKDIAGIKTEPTHNCFGLRAYYKNVSDLDEENFIELLFLKEILPCYFWIFPATDGMVNVGIGVRADMATQKKINLKKVFESVIENEPVLKKRFEKAEKIGEVKLFGLPLGSKKRKLSGDHYMLCGDAAQLIDPFTGEGIGNAMFSGMYAAEQVERCLKATNFSAAFMAQYDKDVYRRMGTELKLSTTLARLVNFQGLFNYIVRKANSNKELAETISMMFEDIDMRTRLRNPLFYLRILFS